MTEELLYTSAPRGLKPGSSGFCTVVSTHGMSAPLAQTLESLSGYRHLHPPGDPRSKSNPVVFSHLRVSTGGKTYSILSRVADYGLDYSQRTNKLAHHIVVDPRERPAAGPAWLLSQPGFMATSWDGEVHILPHGRPIPRGELSPAPCHTWKQITGDAGWAGVLAQSWLENPERLAFLRVEPDMPVLALIQEALALIPPARRWEVTFSTYTTTLPQSATCQWRCVLNGSKEANEARRFVHDLQLNLCQALGMAPNIPATAAARSGTLLNTSARQESDTPQQSEAAEADEAHLAKPYRVVPSSHDSPSETYRLQRTVSPPPPHLPPPVPAKQNTSRKHVWLMAGVSIAVVMLAAGAAFLWQTSTKSPVVAVNASSSDPDGTHSETTSENSSSHPDPKETATTPLDLSAVPQDETLPYNSTEPSKSDPISALTTLNADISAVLGKEMPSQPAAISDPPVQQEKKRPELTITRLAGLSKGVHSLSHDSRQAATMSLVAPILSPLSKDRIDNDWKQEHLNESLYLRNIHGLANTTKARFYIEDGKLHITDIADDSALEHWAWGALLVSSQSDRNLFIFTGMELIDKTNKYTMQNGIPLSANSPKSIPVICRRCAVLGKTDDETKYEFVWNKNANAATLISPEMFEQASLEIVMNGDKLARFKLNTIPDKNSDNEHTRIMAKKYTNFRNGVEGLLSEMCKPTSGHMELGNYIKNMFKSQFQAVETALLQSYKEFENKRSHLERESKRVFPGQPMKPDQRAGKYLEVLESLFSRYKEHKDAEAAQSKRESVREAILRGEIASLSCGYLLDIRDERNNEFNDGMYVEIISIKQMK